MCHEHGRGRPVCEGVHACGTVRLFDALGCEDDGNGGHDMSADRWGQLPQYERTARWDRFSKNCDGCFLKSHGWPPKNEELFCTGPLIMHPFKRHTRTSFTHFWFVNHGPRCKHDVVQYDGTIRDCSNRVVQFEYTRCPTVAGLRPPTRPAWTPSGRSWCRTDPSSRMWLG